MKKNDEATEKRVCLGLLTHPPWEWDKDPLFEEGNRGVEKNSMSPVIGGFCFQLVL